MPGDVPLITAADVESILARHSRFTLVPDTEGDGTNCIVSSPPNLIRYRFDGHSFKPHAEAAYGIGITPLIVRNDAFGSTWIPRAICIACWSGRRPRARAGA